MRQKNFLIICGEPSGELHAAGLAGAIKKLNPEIKITGIGSGLLKKAGAEVFYDIKGLSVMGLFDVLKKIPKFLALKKTILEKIKKDNPDAIIFVDFSGFNLRLAKAINNAIPTIYYVSPQVWASRPGRIKTMKKYIKKIIVLFKFEREFYQKYGIDADWAGQPLLDIVKPTMPKEELLRNLKLSSAKVTIALLPGSRKQEIKRILPVMLKSARLIAKELNAQFVIAKPLQVEWNIYNSLIKCFHLNLKIVEDRPYDCMNIADFCLICSGTATLETAIMGKPFFLIYKTSLLNYLLYRPQIKVPYIGMVNIAAGKKIIPEFIQFGASPKKIANSVLGTLKNPAELQSIKANLAKIKSSLGASGAASRAAKIILDFLK
ncbi:MAG: lipid-A-disaccharide synthase [Candidatus Omnitrophica bacterium CG08_land_8_20_14_0_20_41_16]|nr:MAG: lipid-A-disaccharide synthase [Candidatus Omnitrophica bacterium CG08_land_8_20_14_0_20_41_16]